MVEQKSGGVFLGRARIAKKSTNGGARHCTASFQGMKNDLVYILWGGVLANPFPGRAKLFEGDMLYQELDDKAEHPKLYCLKTYEAAEASTGTTLKIVKDGFRHIPFVGDTLMVAPETIGGTGTVANVTAKKVSKTTDGQDIWELTLDAALTVAKGDILVEGNAEDNSMLVKGINCFAPQDYDFVFEPAADPEDAEDFENAEYELTPVIGFTGFIHRMSPIPACVLKLNQSRFNGVWSFNALNASV